MLRLGLGDHFVGSRGLAPGGERHDAFPYTVTGVLAHGLLATLGPLLVARGGLLIEPSVGINDILLILGGA